MVDSDRTRARVGPCRAGFGAGESYRRDPALGRTQNTPAGQPPLIRRPELPVAGDVTTPQRRPPNATLACIAIIRSARRFALHRAVTAGSASSDASADTARNHAFLIAPSRGDGTRGSPSV